MIEPSFTWPMRPGHWELLVPGTGITMVKRTHDGRDVVNYPGRIVPTDANSPWVEVEAMWTAGTVIQGPLTFATGDTLREFFSWKHPYNAFAVFSPAKQLKGWYANVTYPSWVEQDDYGVRLYWQDLWLDVVSDASGNTVNLDDDELEESGLAHQDSHLHQAILQARSDILTALEIRSGPFTQSND